MARKRQNITIIGRAANRRVQTAITKLQNQFGFATDQATAVALRMESNGQLGFGGQPETKKEQSSGAKSLAAFATAQLFRNRTPKKTETTMQESIQSASAAEYQRNYLETVPLKYTTNKKRPKKR